MQDLLNEIVSSSNVEDLGRRFGVSGADAQAGLSALLPVLTGAARHKARREDGLASLAESIGSSDLEELFGGASPHSERAVDEGNRLLGELLGTKDNSRHVAAKASEKTGLDPSLLKKLLPIAAGLLASFMAKKGAQTGSGAAEGKTGGGGLTDVLGSMLDKDGDGNALDDVLGGLFGGK